ncbi:hypothetical protein CU048_07110 [Beijerinckiaceae bacterium]|nr:hypothetical protein CU048_07110 [Beijerinckiaceae bacterium]
MSILISQPLRIRGWSLAVAASLFAYSAGFADAVPYAAFLPKLVGEGISQVKLKAKPSSQGGTTPSEVAGRYAILREGGKDTGCMLTLDGQVKARGGDKATLSPACRDQGIVIFDPMAWRIVDGRLVLTARKGHITHLDAQPDGTWKKDASEGKGLSLKKL